jgi:putative membrane protein
VDVTRKVTLMSGLLAGAMMLVAQTPQQGTANRMSQPMVTDQQVLSKMHDINQLEIKVGTLATKNSSSPDVRRYGERLVRDHKMIDRNVERVAQRLRITLPTPPAEPPLFERLQGLTGRQFDDAFLPAMVQGHDQAISTLQDDRQSLPQQSQVSALITKSLPILKEHRNIAANLQKAGK